MTIKLRPIRTHSRRDQRNAALHKPARSALVAITMCIGAGIDTKPGLIGWLKTYGFTAGHIAQCETTASHPQFEPLDRDGTPVSPGRPSCIMPTPCRYPPPGLESPHEALVRARFRLDFAAVRFS